MIASSACEELVMKPAYSSCFGLSGPTPPAASSWVKPMMLVERRAQLVGHVVDEVVAQLFGRHQRLVALGQRALDVGARGHVEEGQQRRAVRQRQGGAVERELVRALDPGREALAMLVKADHHAAQPVPQRGLAAQRPAAFARSRRYADGRRGRAGSMPHIAANTGIEQLHPPVGAEHRDAFLERVERLALHVGQRRDLRGERVALRGVVVEIGDAALRIGAGDDAQRPPVRQIPDRLARLDRLVGLHQLRLPGAEVRLLRQLPLGPKPVENLAVGRLGVEERRLERPHLAVGGVVEGEPLRLVEDRHRGRQAVDHAGIVVFVALHLGFQRRGLGDVIGDAGRSERRAAPRRPRRFGARRRRPRRRGASRRPSRAAPPPPRGASPDRTARRD